MNSLERRDFLKGTATGVFAFTVGGVEIIMSAREAYAQNVPFRLLQANEAETVEALGETLVPGARAAGIAHFIDQQLSVPPEEALLEARGNMPTIHLIGGTIMGTKAGIQWSTATARPTRSRTCTWPGPESSRPAARPT